MSMNHVSIPSTNYPKSSVIMGGILNGTVMATIEAVSTPVFLFKIVLATQFCMWANPRCVHIRYSPCDGHS